MLYTAVGTGMQYNPYLVNTGKFADIEQLPKPDISLKMSMFFIYVSLF